MYSLDDDFQMCALVHVSMRVQPALPALSEIGKSRRLGDSKWQCLLKITECPFPTLTSEVFFEISVDSLVEYFF